MNVFEGRQLSAARGLAGLTVIQLATEAAVTPRTIHRLEVAKGAIHVSEKKRHGHLSRAIWTKIRDALARHHVELVPEGDNFGAGARWSLPRSARPSLDSTTSAQDDRPSTI